VIEAPRPERRPLVERLWARSEIRYLVVGGLCFLADIAFLWLLHDVARLPLAIATPIAFLGSFAVTYTLQRVLAFNSDAAVAPSVLRYAILVAFNTVAVTAIVWAVDAAIGSWLTGKILAVISTTIWNYFAYRYWVFARPKDESD